MKTHDLINQANDAVARYLDGAVGHFDRQAYGSKFLIDALDALKAYVLNEGPRPVLQLESPVQGLADYQLTERAPQDMPRFIQGTDMPLAPGAVPDAPHYPSAHEQPPGAGPLPYPLGPHPYAGNVQARGEERSAYDRIQDVANKLRGEGHG